MTAVHKNLEHVEDQTYALCAKAIRHNYRALKHVKNQTPELCKLAIRMSPYAIQYVRDQTRELCLMAIEKQPKVITLIRNQTQEICEKAMSIDPSILLGIDKPYRTEDMVMKAIGVDGSLIRMVDNPTMEMVRVALKQTHLAIYDVPEHMLSRDMYLDVFERDCRILKKIPIEYVTFEMCERAVIAWGSLIRFVPEQWKEELYPLLVESSYYNYVPISWRTEDTDMRAIQFFPENLIDVINPTPQMCLEAVRRDGLTIELIKDQSEDLCWEALYQSVFSLEYILSPTEDMCLFAVKKDSQTLAFVDRQTPEMIDIALAGDPSAIHHVKNQTEDLCWSVLKRDPMTIIYIQHPTFEMLKYVLPLVPVFGRLSDRINQIYHENPDQYYELCDLISQASDLNHIQYQTEEIAMKAVTMDGHALQFVDNQTEEVCLQAMRSDPHTIASYIFDPELREHCLSFFV